MWKGEHRRHHKKALEHWLKMAPKHANHWEGQGWKKKQKFHSNNSLVRVLIVYNVQGKATKFVPTAPVPLVSGCAMNVVLWTWYSWAKKDCKADLIHCIKNSKKGCYFSSYLALISIWNIGHSAIFEIIMKFWVEYYYQSIGYIDFNT